MVVEVFGDYVAIDYHRLAIPANFPCAATVSFHDCFGTRKGNFIRFEALSADLLNDDDGPQILRTWCQSKYARSCEKRDHASVDSTSLERISIVSHRTAPGAGIARVSSCRLSSFLQIASVVIKESYNSLLL
jgi:hypothetical protein